MQGAAVTIRTLMGSHITVQGQDKLTKKEERKVRSELLIGFLGKYFTAVNLGS